MKLVESLIRLGPPGRLLTPAPILRNDAHVALRSINALAVAFATDATRVGRGAQG